MFRRALLVTLLVAALVMLAAPVTAQGESIIFWSTETQPARAAITQEIIAGFTEATGINVSLVLTDENSLPNLMTANNAAGTLPDVVFHPVDFTATWYNEGILDSDAATAIIEELGADSFSALGLVGNGMGGYMAVPTDGWGQLLIYRADLFEAAGLEAPTTFAAIEAAAMALNDPENNFYGIAAATDPGAVFTQQTFEHFALANGVSLTDGEGTVTLNTPAMVEAIDFYANLVSSYGPPGVQDVVSTRATYFAGQAAMIVWSPFILDEMAGLRDNAFPACEECGDDPAFLAANSAIVPSFVGPSGMEPVQYGQVSNMGLTTGASEAAMEFVKYWLSDGYLAWLGTSPEGKFPMLRGNADSDTFYIDGWSTLETGVDRRAPLSEFYGEDVIQTLIEGASGFARWGFNEGQGALVGGVYQELPVTELLSEVINGSLTAEEAAEEIQFLVEEIQAAQAE